MYSSPTSRLSVPRARGSEVGWGPLDSAHRVVRAVDTLKFAEELSAALSPAGTAFSGHAGSLGCYR
jgi:hypothetical protein